VSDRGWVELTRSDRAREGRDRRVEREEGGDQSDGVSREEVGCDEGLM